MLHGVLHGHGVFVLTLYNNAFKEEYLGHCVMNTQGCIFSSLACVTVKGNDQVLLYSDHHNQISVAEHVRQLSHASMGLLDYR